MCVEVIGASTLESNEEVVVHIVHENLALVHVRLGDP